MSGDAAIAETAAAFCNSCEPLLLPRPANCLSASGSGRESSPPTRIIQPEVPRFSGRQASADFSSMHPPATVSAFAALLRRFCWVEIWGNPRAFYGIGAAPAEIRLSVPRSRAIPNLER